jgi:hypothetical protein
MADTSESPALGTADADEFHPRLVLQAQAVRGPIQPQTVTHVSGMDQNPERRTDTASWVGRLDGDWQRTFVHCRCSHRSSGVAPQLVSDGIRMVQPRDVRLASTMRESCGYVAR